MLPTIMGEVSNPRPLAEPSRFGEIGSGGFGEIVYASVANDAGSMSTIGTTSSGEILKNRILFQ